jgi:hypothetical protein
MRCSHPHSCALPDRTVFWREVLTSAFVRPFTHIFVFDSDMDARPAAFDLVNLIRIQGAVGVSIISPAPYGPGSGMFNIGAHPDATLRPACREGLPERTCAVCRHPTVEVKAPLFTAAAWRLIHGRIFAAAPDFALVAASGIDNAWCGLAAHVLHNCTWPRALDRADKRLPDCIGISCAYSYATPMVCAALLERARPPSLERALPSSP